MSTVTVHLPDSLHAAISEIARRDGISVEQFIVAAAAEKLSALLGREPLERRATRASRDAFEWALSQVPNVEPDEQDRL